MANPPDTDGTIWTQRGFLIAAAAVGLIAVLAIVLALTNGAEKGTSKEGAVPAGPAVTVTTSGKAARPCSLPAGDQTLPTTAPSGTRWELVGKIAVPSAPRTLGPGQVRDGLRSCFARSPVGALYATVNVLAMAAYEKTTGAAIRKLVADGQGRDAALAAFKREGAATAAPDARFQVAGFQITSYEPALAQVDLALRVDTGTTQGLVHLPSTLTWQAGDWKLVIPANGKAFTNVAPITALDGYIRWSGA